jgi:DNA-directed RNA polymerase specialized sigma24 family protein
VMVTEELVRWTARISEQYARRRRDASGRFEAEAMLALARCSRRWADRPEPVPFEVVARQQVRTALAKVIQRHAPLGYRNPKVRPAVREEPPTTFALDESRDAPVPVPVGWEVEFEDYVEHLAGSLAGRQAQVLRLMYLEARGGTIARIAKELGITYDSAHKVHESALARLRAIYGRTA